MLSSPAALILAGEHYNFNEVPKIRPEVFDYARFLQRPSLACLEPEPTKPDPQTNDKYPYPLEYYNRKRAYTTPRDEQPAFNSYHDAVLNSWDFEKGSFLLFTYYFNQQFQSQFSPVTLWNRWWALRRHRMESEGEKVP